MKKKIGLGLSVLAISLGSLPSSASASTAVRTTKVIENAQARCAAYVGCSGVSVLSINHATLWDTHGRFTFTTRWCGRKYIDNAVRESTTWWYGSSYRMLWSISSGGSC